MTLSIPEFNDRLGHAKDTNRLSKARQRRAELILRNEWHTVWPKDSAGYVEPAVENVYLEAAEDKAATAAAIMPIFDVPPRRGGRADRAEQNAQRARHVFITLTQESRIDAHHIGFYLDWFIHGLPAAMVWKDWTDPEGFPYLMRLEPRNVFPIAWDSRGRLAEVMVIRRRRIIDLIRDWGPSHPAFRRLTERSGGKIDSYYEEITWADNRSWARALSVDAAGTSGELYRPPDLGTHHTLTEWLVEPHPHGLDANPVIAQRAIAIDGEIRGKLDAMLPPLRMAHAISTEVLIGMRKSMHAPPLMQNVENETDFGPDAILRGTPGPDAAVVAYPRPPANLEAFTHVKDQIEAARGAGAFPQQRGGQPGASIASGQAVDRLQGSYNAQQSWAQTDILRFYTDCFARLANMDETWCGGYVKDITGFDEGEAYMDTYDPATFWNGDYRVRVGFHAMGVDVHTNLMTVLAAHSRGLMSRRTTMRQSGLVRNPMAEERDQALEEMHMAFTSLLAFEAQNGDDTALVRYAELMDGGDTPRDAMNKVLAERKKAKEQAMLAAQAQQQEAMMGGGGMMGPGGGGPPGGGAPQVDPAQLMAMMGGAQ